MVLVQACQDTRRAYRNWFDSRSGKRHGRRVGRPRFRTKHGRQSIRLTRNGFALHGTIDPVRTALVTCRADVARSPTQRPTDP